MRKVIVSAFLQITDDDDVTLAGGRATKGVSTCKIGW